MNDKEKMETHLLQHSQTHFSQAHSTPFTRSLLTELLNFDGITPFGDTIFEGCLPPIKLDITLAT